jgi:hypothetical protein
LSVKTTGLDGTASRSEICKNARHDGDAHGRELRFEFKECAYNPACLVAIKDTPLWFYILREAELNRGKLKGVGARIVAETFHRAMEGSQASIVRDPS